VKLPMKSGKAVQSSGQVLTFDSLDAATASDAFLDPCPKLIITHLPWIETLRPHLLDAV
jgi:hypothetical protein